MGTPALPSGAMSAPGLVLVSLEPKGVGVIERLFPAFNQGEAFVSASLTEQEKNQLASLLRKIIRSVEEP